MGLCFSCFGRRRQRRARSAVADNERDPLIGTQRTSYSSADLFNRTAQVAAALRSGKLPSQQQLEHILQSVLQSDVLKVSAQGTLSPEGVKVIEDVRELVTVLLIVGLEKNPDDIFQNFIYNLAQARKLSLAPDPNALVAEGQQVLENIQNQVLNTSELAADMLDIINCSRQLLGLLIASGASRILLFHLVFLLRQMIASIAQTVDVIAQNVEATAHNVEKMAEAIAVASEEVTEAIQVDSVAEASKTDAGEIQSKVVRALDDAADTLKKDDQAKKNTVHTTQDNRSAPADMEEVAVDQIRQILRDAVKNPEYLSALQTSLRIFQKYMDRIYFGSAASVVEEALQTDAPPAIHFSDDAKEHATKLLFESKTVLERFASGASLDLVVNDLSDILFQPPSDKTLLSLRVPDAVNPSRQAQKFWDEYVSSIQTFLTKLRKEPAYLASSEGTDDLKRLVHRGRVLYNARSDFYASDKAKNLIKDISTFIEALKKDRTTTRLATVGRALRNDVAAYVSTASAAVSQKKQKLFTLSNTAWNDLRSYLAPRLLNMALRLLWPRDASDILVPLPRIEFKQGLAVEAAVDPRFMHVSSHLQDPSCLEAYCSCIRPPVEDGFDDADDDTTAISDLILPASIRIQRTNEVQIDMAQSALETGATGLSTSNKVHIRVDDLFAVPISQRRTIGFHGIAYYVLYRGWLGLGYEDSGELDVDVDVSLGKQGASLDLDIEWDFASQSPAQTEGNFRVTSAHVTLPSTMGVRPAFYKSKHSLLNNFLVEPVLFPLLRSVAKRRARIICEQVISDLVEKTGRGLLDIAQDAQKRAALSTSTDDSLPLPRPGDWAAAVADAIQQTLSSSSSSEPNGAAETTTDVSLTTKGLQFKNRPTSPPLDDASVADPETIVAVGVAPQLFPSHAVPEPDVPPSEVAKEQVKVAVANVSRAAETTIEAAEGMTTHVQDLGHEIGHAEEVYEETVDRENLHGKDDWRSSAFD